MIMMMEPRFMLCFRPYFSLMTGTRGSARIEPSEYVALMKPSFAEPGLSKSSP